MTGTAKLTRRADTHGGETTMGESNISRWLHANPERNPCTVDHCLAAAGQPCTDAVTGQPTPTVHVARSAAGIADRLELLAKLSREQRWHLLLYGTLPEPVAADDDHPDVIGLGV